MPTILVVDDEHNIVELARLYLTNESYRVIEAGDGEAALELVHTQQPDLMVLDIMLPNLDGWEVCKRLRKEGNELPIIMLTARDDDVDKIVGLEIGADDYMTKPFNPRELVARVKAVLRRTEAQPKLPRVITVGPMCLDRARREATIGERELKLRTKEFGLLATFVENEGLVLSREQILKLVWGYDFYGDSRTVDVHVARLREKLGEAGITIETVWGIGYKLVAD
ncbi:MAG: response regulator transcription factor [Desulfobacterales bacterium]|nr:response regulator transcription factor [Anaerolineae bacterium]MCG2772749.1 response regulator transcription factor [Desulfobacterales bacterium]